MQTMVPLYGFGGGGGTGAALTVTAPAGCTVTVSKDGKTKTRVASADGVAVFKGLSTGEWILTINDGSQTASKPVMITANYSAAITFFAATIHVTYPEGSVCTATDGVTTLTAPDTSGTWDCVVPNAGTWTVAATDGSSTASHSVSITADGQSDSVTLNYDLYIFTSGSGLTTGCTFSNVEKSSLSPNSLIANTDDEYLNGSSFYITTNINFDGYSRLNFDLVGYKYTGQYEPNPHVIYGCSRNTAVTGNGEVPTASNYTASSKSLPTTRKTVSIDISSVSNNKYVKVETLDARLVIYNIWFN